MIRVHLSRLLRDRRMTRAELARKTGIRPNTICDWYHELTDRVNLEHLNRICEALDCTVGDLLEYYPD